MSGPIHGLAPDKRLPGKSRPCYALKKTVNTFLGKPMFEPIRQFRRKLKAGQLCLGVGLR